MLLRATEKAETRTLILIGAAVVLCAALAGLLVAINPFDGQREDVIAVAIRTPYVGQGVTKGTSVILHGLKVGEVTAVSSLPGGGVRLDTQMQAKPVAGLTDTMKVDFRPANYFGVTGVNLIAGPGGRALRDGTSIRTEPQGNFALQTLLSRLGDLSGTVLTPQLIQVVDKATRYTDGLDPLLETILIVGNALAETQTVSTAQLLTNATGISVVAPSFVSQLTDAGDHFSHGDLADPELFETTVRAILDEAQTGLYGTIGKLEYSHVADLLPAINSVKALTDIAPPLIRPQGVAEMLVDLRGRLEKLYGGTPEQRAIQVQIVLDSLPGVASAAGVSGADR